MYRLCTENPPNKISEAKAHDAYDYFTSCDTQNAVAATNTCDEAVEQGVSNSTFGFFKTLRSLCSRLKDNVYRSETGVYVRSIWTLEKERAFENIIETTQAEKHLKERIPVCSGNEISKISTNAEQDLENDHLLEKGSKEKMMLKKTTISRRECVRNFDHHKTYKNYDMKTLEDSLIYFSLSSQLQQLETSLEDVRRHKKNKEDHEDCFKKIDKEIQKLSFNYHPDKVKNRGGTEEDVTLAQKLQTALNATRTVLKLLNSAFMEDINIDHKFEFYTHLNIESLCNEDEMQNCIFEIMLEISKISRIKQQNIISEIRKFLIESKSCVRSYVDGTAEFKKHRDLALFYLKRCIVGFEKLSAELHKIKEKLESEKNNENFLSAIKKMASDSKRNLELLKSLNEIAVASIKGRYRFFNPGEVMDSYFVLPLVWCMNVILMCNTMMRDASVFHFLNKFKRELDPCDNDDFRVLMVPYYLASYCSGNNHYRKKILEIMRNNDHLVEDERYGICVMQISKAEIESKFREHIKEVDEFMECNFKVEYYTATMTTDFITSDLKKCMAMQAEFEQIEQEISKGIKEFQKKTEKMHEQYEKIDKMMDTAEKMN